MTSMSRRSGAFLVAAFVFAGVTCTPALVAAQSNKEVPGPERISPAVVNYSRVTPQIAAAGLLRGNAVAELKSLGFAMIVDLRGPAEGTDVEQKAAAQVAIRYANIPVTTDVPTDAQLVEFSRLVEDAGNYPMIVHCGSANRVGAMWALYRAARGAPFEAALAEGRRIGMQAAREQAVRERLAKPPFTK
jgi:uncharacterized protein (TIGR01244 family)